MRYAFQAVVAALLFFAGALDSLQLLGGVSLLGLLGIFLAVIGLAFFFVSLRRYRREKGRTD